MLQTYTLNTQVGANSPIPLNSIAFKKGYTVTKPSADTIDLNICGVYMVSVDATAEAETTIQLYKDGVAKPQAQSTGTSLSFTTIVQVPNNNTNCPCSSPVSLQLMNTTATTFTNCNVVVTKLV